MNSFGSFKLRIVWASIAIFLFGLFLAGFSTSEGPQGFSIHAFGATIPPNMLASVNEFYDPMKFILSILRTLIGWTVPFTFFATAYFPLVEAIESDKLKGFFTGALLGAASGLFYSQLLILPIWAFCLRIMGSILPGALVMADLHAVILGLQLLIWGIILNRLIRSNRGVPMVLTMGLSAIGTKLYNLIDFGEASGMMTAGQIKVVTFLNQLLPSAHIAEDSIALGTLLYGVLGTLVLAALLVIIPMGKKK